MWRELGPGRCYQTCRSLASAPGPAQSAVCSGVCASTCLLSAEPPRGLEVPPDGGSTSAWDSARSWRGPCAAGTAPQAPRGAAPPLSPVRECRVV